MNKFAILKAILITVLFVVSTSMYAQLKNFGVTFTKRATIMSIHEILDPPAEHKVKNTKVEIGYAGSDEQDLAQTGIYGMFYINDADLNIKSNFYDSDEDNEISISIVVYDIQGGSDDTHTFLCSGMLIEDYIYLGLKSKEGFDVSDDINRIYIIVFYDDSSAEPITVLIKEGELEIEDGDIEGPMTAYFSFDITDDDSGNRSSYDTKSSTGYLNGHQWVDLGLPSGTKWATCNVGANSPEESGNYYAWGETITKSTYNNSKTYGKNIPDFAGDARYDAASASWGANWEMPTRTQIDELLDKRYCVWEWTKINGTNGYKVTSTENGNSIFLPAAGYRVDTSLCGNATLGYYWCSTPLSSSKDAYGLYIDNNGHFYSYYYRYIGCMVRAVTNR